MYLFLMSYLWSSNWPTAVGHEAIRDALDYPKVGIFPGQIVPNLSLAVDPLALPSLRSLLLGSRFTASLSKYTLYLDAPSGLAARGNRVNGL
jgi:hypothetical protein